MGGRQGDAARDPRDDGAVVAGRGEGVDLALVDVQDGEAGDLGGAATAVADVPADERELHVLGGVQRGEGADAVRRRVVRDEEDRPRVGRGQRTASS